MMDDEELKKHGRSSPEPMRFPTCMCGAAGIRHEMHDCYYCPKSGVWLEPKCGSTICSTCARRPDRLF